MCDFQQKDCESGDNKNNKIVSTDEIFVAMPKPQVLFPLNK